MRSVEPSPAALRGFEGSKKNAGCVGTAHGVPRTGPDSCERYRTVAGHLHSNGLIITCTSAGTCDETLRVRGGTAP